MKNLGKRLISLGLSVVVSGALFVSAGVMSFAYTETTGTVSSANVKVRSSASTTASQVSSLKSGDTVEIVDEASDASGYTWYKIRVNKTDFGYVRSDLVDKKGGSSASSEVATTTKSNTTESNAAAASLPATTVTTVDPKSATITTDSANVRQGAGTGYDSVGKVSKGDTVTVTGEATGSDNKTWYQVTFGSSNKTGFIRGDLLQLGDAAPSDGSEGGENAEGEASEGGEGEASEGEEEQEGSEESGSDSGSATTSEAGDGTYSLVYSTDDSGNGIWYLYDNVGGYRVKVNELIEAAKSSDEVGNLTKTNNTYKTVLVILAVVIAALVVGMILLALKLRESYYEDVDEEEEYDRYSKPARKRARDDEEEEPAPRAKRPVSEERTVKPSREEADRAARPQRQTRRDEEFEERPVRNKRPASEYDDDNRSARRATEDRGARRQTEERPVRRSTEDRPVRQTRRSEEDDDRQVRRSSYRNSEEGGASREGARRKPRNIVSDVYDLDSEFEFLDLNDKD